MLGTATDEEMKDFILMSGCINNYFHNGLTILYIKLLCSEKLYSFCGLLEQFLFLFVKRSKK